MENFLAVENGPPWSHPYDPTKGFVGPFIIKMQVTTNAAGVKVIGAFDGFLVDK